MSTTHDEIRKYAWYASTSIRHGFQPVELDTWLQLYHSPERYARRLKSSPGQKTFDFDAPKPLPAAAPPTAATGQTEAGSPWVRMQGERGSTYWYNRMSNPNNDPGGRKYQEEKPGDDDTGEQEATATAKPAVDAEAKEPWQMTPNEYVGDRTGATEVSVAHAAHPGHVKRALAEGKPVPDTVLQAYRNNGWAANELEKRQRGGADGKEPQGELRIPEPGKPFTFTSLHNKEKSPNMGDRFGQHVEPAGRYVTAIGDDDTYLTDAMPDKYERAKVTFENPLVVEFGGGYTEDSNWKKVLSKQYGGLTGKKLSEAIRADGYDGIVTVEPEKGPNRPKRTAEIVDLRTHRPTNPQEPTDEPPSTSQENPADQGQDSGQDQTQGGQGEAADTQGESEGRAGRVDLPSNKHESSALSRAKVIKALMAMGMPVDERQPTEQLQKQMQLRQESARSTLAKYLPTIPPPTSGEANAPARSKYNGWEIVPPSIGGGWFIRHPDTKHIVYGKQPDMVAVKRKAAILPPTDSVFDVLRKPELKVTQPKQRTSTSKAKKGKTIAAVDEMGNAMGNVEISERVHKNWGIGKLSNGQWALVNVHNGMVDLASHDKSRLLERMALAGMGPDRHALTPDVAAKHLYSLAHDMFAAYYGGSA